MNILLLALALIFAGFAGLAANCAVALAALPLVAYRWSMSALAFLVVFLILDVAFRLP